MAASGKETPTLPPIKIDQPEKSESIRSERPSSTPVPSRATNVASSERRLGPLSAVHPGSVPHRFLSSTEWARIAHGVGAIEGAEKHTVAHPTSWYWPPKGLPDGLYRDVIFERTKNFHIYYTLSAIRWILMVLQIVIGAVLTALGSLHTNDSIPIMVLAAINTVDAGLLALMHNSGLPDRYRLNKEEFSRVENFLKELLDTGIVENGQTVDEVLADCFERFQTAKTTVLHNMPDYYTVTPARNRLAKQLVVVPDTEIHTHSPHFRL